MKALLEALFGVQDEPSEEPKKVIVTEELKEERGDE